MILERLILARLSRDLEADGCLTCNQHGFREDRDTVHAIREVLNITESAIAGADSEGACDSWSPLTLGTPSIQHYGRQ